MKRHRQRVYFVVQKQCILPWAPLPSQRGKKDGRVRMWATGYGVLLSTDHRLQEELNTEVARRQGAARPPGATRRRLGRGHHILYAGKLPPKTPEPMLDTSRQKHSRDGPSVAAVCVSPTGWRFVRRLKLGVVPAYHRAGRMMKSRRRREEGDSRGGELRGRRVVAFK